MEDANVCPYVLRNFAGQKPKYGQAPPLYMEMVKKWKHHFRDVVHKIHTNYGSLKPPIGFEPMEAYLSGFNIRYIPFDPKKIGIELDGFYKMNGGDVRIFYAVDLGEQRSRFTIAHELIHVLQRFDLEFMADMEAIEDENLRQVIIERIAEIAASYYLAPEKLVRFEYMFEPRPRQLAETFNVSRAMMKICVSDYKLATYK